MAQGNGQIIVVRIDTTPKTPFIESLAVFTQMRWEKVAYHYGCTLTEPHLDDAVDAVEQFLRKSDLLQSHIRNAA